MKFISHTISGKGRGKKIGVPTLNLLIPKDLDLGEGIYAAKVKIKGIAYRGALHFGPIPVFSDTNQNLEIHLLDTDIEVPEGDEVEIEVFQKIRDIRNFDSTDALVEQIQEDIKKINQILDSSI
jgi:riboflavin kinase / FMN adenylyltransferase